MANNRPRVRSSIESSQGGTFHPPAPGFATAPNIGSSAYKQTNPSSNTYFLAADVVTTSSPAQNSSAGTFVLLYKALVPFPNIPVSQGVAPSNLSPLKQGQSSNIAPTGSTTLLFKVHGSQCTLTPSGLFIAEFSVTPYVVDTGGLVYTNAYLPAGGNYRTFGAMVTVLAYNPGTTAVNGVVAHFTINGDLSAGYPQGATS